MPMNNELSGDELMRLIEARERRAARRAAMPAPELPTDVLVAEPVSASDNLTPELLRQIQEQGTVRVPRPAPIYIDESGNFIATPDEPSRLTPLPYIPSLDTGRLQTLEIDSKKEAEKKILGRLGRQLQTQAGAVPAMPMPQTSMTVAPVARAQKPERMPLVAPPQPAPGLGSMTPEESQALAEMTLGQSRNARLEAVLPFVRASQQINQAWTGAPVDVEGLQAAQATLRRPETEAAQRLALAREFAKRRMEGESLEKQLAQRQQMAQMDAQQAKERLEFEKERNAKALELEQQQLELRRQAEERLGRQRAEGGDALTRRKRELEVAKLERELAEGPDNVAALERQVKAERAKAELTGQPTPAEKKKQREQMVEIRDRSNNIQRNLAELEKLIDEEGTYNVVGAHNKKLASKIYQIAVDTAKLVDPSSVAREGEVASAQKYMLFEPSPFIRDSTAKEIIAEFKRSAAERLKSAYDVRGIQPFEETEAPQAPSWTNEKQKRLEELRAKQAKAGE